MGFLIDEDVKWHILKLPIYQRKTVCNVLLLEGVNNISDKERNEITITE